MNRTALLYGVAGILAATPAPGQDAPTQPAIRPSEAIPFDPQAKPQEPEAPPQILLGRRMTALRAAAAQVGAVVIVSDADSYFAALSAWRPDKRFPVLVDDGTSESREDIARFVRAYRPASVVRWTLPVAEGAARPVVGAPGFERVSAERYNAAVQSAWGIATPGPDQKTLLEAWKTKGHRPPGVVVTCVTDTAWPGGLALAAAWGQPSLLTKSPPGNIDWTMTPGTADILATEIEQECEASGFEWKKLGDDIEAVTLALNCPERLVRTSHETLALTDRIGRLGSHLDASERWAWAGHVFGSASRSAYWAMCSIFVQPRGAWLFDGYPAGPPWEGYDATAAGNILKETGMTVETMDLPRGSVHAWRQRAAKPVNAGLIMVNTRGNADFFDLEPGQGKPGDVPMLEVPAAVSVVHSWSLLFPGKRDLLGGRWLERGAFCYAGSVHEPYLHAFVKTPVVAGRFSTGAPWATCVRTDDPKIWKVAVLGDPLYNFAPRVNRVEAAPPLDGAVAVGQDLRELLTAEKYLEGVRALLLLGRDADIARLAAVLVEKKPEKMDSPLAAECILPAFRADDAALVTRLFGRLNAAAQKDPILRDALWLSAYPRLEKPDDVILLTILRNNLRPDQLERDAAAVAAAWSVKYGAASTGELFADWRARFTDKGHREALEKAAKSPAVWGR